MNINYLKIPIANLYDIDDLNDFKGFKKSGLECFIGGYEKSEIDGVIEALKWAVENPDYDFSSMLPNIKHSNKDIYEYLCEFEEVLSSSVMIK